MRVQAEALATFSGTSLSWFAPIHCYLQVLALAIDVVVWVGGPKVPFKLRTRHVTKARKSGISIEVSQVATSGRRSCFYTPCRRE